MCPYAVVRPPDIHDHLCQKDVTLRSLDFSSWQGVLTTLIGLALFTLLGVGARLLVMMTVQQRRERLNRQINERLRTLIAAYKVLGGSFSGDLAVDPAHLRDIRRRTAPLEGAPTATLAPSASAVSPPDASERARRIRDAVEGSLSDIILLGTEEQVRLAATAAQELAAGRMVHTTELVVSLRNFVRSALDLEAIPAGVMVPSQGPSRVVTAGGRSKGDGAGGRQGGSGLGGDGGGHGGSSLGGDDGTHEGASGSGSRS